MPHIIKKSASFLCLFVASLGYLFIKAYLWTLRITLHREAQTVVFLKGLPSGAVFIIWHDSILLMPLLIPMSIIKQTNILISNSTDGDIPSEIANMFTNVEVIRVRHSSRQTALKQGVELLRENHNLIITPDGPKGPRHRIKDGCIFAANATCSPIIPVVWTASKQCCLHSWDRFRIPLPFSKVHLTFLPAVFPHLEQANSNIKKNLEERMEQEEERLFKLLQKHGDDNRANLED
jgi:lysophospholipid acyltransferase (LPLAT)-like uncharacterized protein